MDELNIAIQEFMEEFHKFFVTSFLLKTIQGMSAKSGNNSSFFNGNESLSDEFDDVYIVFSLQDNTISSLSQLKSCFIVHGRDGFPGGKLPIEVEKVLINKDRAINFFNENKGLFCSSKREYLICSLNYFEQTIVRYPNKCFRILYKKCKFLKY